MIEISGFDKRYAMIRIKAGPGSLATSNFIVALQRRRQPFQRLLDCGQHYYGLEWERVPAFRAYCATKGIDTCRRGQ